MIRSLRNFLIVVAIIVIPMVLGTLVVGPTQAVGRNSLSTTRVGHKAYFLLLNELGYRVRRFERGVETLPDDRGTFIALEPGPGLYRNSGRYARRLLEWVERGNAALITLGPDPDHSAEIDDRDQVFGDEASRAIEIANRVQKQAQERARREKVERQAELEEASDGNQLADEVQELDPSESWSSRHVARFLDVNLDDTRMLEITRSSTVVVSGPFAEALGPDVRINMTRPRVWARATTTSSKAGVSAKEPRALLDTDEGPILVEIEVGQGLVLLLSEPRLLHNDALGRAAHARLGVRAVERLTQHAGSDLIYFEEFSHGGREASNILDLVARTRARWLGLQILFIVVAWILFVVWRRRSVVPLEVPPRRSRDEVIDAMASLFLRAGDTSGAANRMAELTRFRLARSLGGVSVKPSELARAVALRLGMSSEEVLARFSADGVNSVRELVERAEQMRLLRGEVEGHGRQDHRT